MTGKQLTDASERDVYFLRPVGFKGPIKIGSGILSEARRRAIEAYSPFRLELLLTMPGGIEMEQRLHRRFAYAHSHCEWFDAVDELVWMIDQILVGVPVEQAINLNLETGDLHSIRRHQMAMNHEAFGVWRRLRRGGDAPAKAEQASAA